MKIYLLLIIATSLSTTLCTDLSSKKEVEVPSLLSALSDKRFIQIEDDNDSDDEEISIKRENYLKILKIRSLTYDLILDKKNSIKRNQLTETLNNRFNAFAQIEYNALNNIKNSLDINDQKLKSEIAKVNKLITSNFTVS